MKVRGVSTAETETGRILKQNIKKTAEENKVGYIHDFVSNQSIRVDELVYKLDYVHVNDDKLNETVTNKVKAGLDRIMKRDLERSRSVILFGLQDFYETREDGTQKEEKKVEILETLGMQKMDKEVERTRKMGICYRGGTRRLLPVSFRSGVNNVEVLRQTYQLATERNIKRCI